MNEDRFPTQNAIRNKRRRLALSVLVISIALHGVFALVAGVWIVVKRFSVPKETPPILTAKPLQKTPAKVREQAMQAAAFEGAMTRSAFNDRILSTRLTKLALPKMPSLPDFTPPSLEAASASLSFQNEASALASGAGAGIGAGGSGPGGTGTGVSFLGVQTNAKRIVLMFDISKTVAGAAARVGMPMERIREETARLIEGLGVNTRFGLVEFARNYAFFRPDLVPSTSTNRNAAIHWLNTFFATEGTLPKGVPNVVSGSPGFLILLEAVFRMQPDSLFIISDGSLQRGTGMSSTIPLHEIEQTLLRLQSSQPVRAKIFFVGVGVQTDTEKGLKRLLASAGGGGAYSELKHDPRSR
jgi:hypothetical protein